jgi:hypothetical protein
MALRIQNVIVETRYPDGTVVCDTNPTDCCHPAPTACCPDGRADTVTYSFTGPVGVDCSTVMETGSLTYGGGSGTWIGGTSVGLFLYCDGSSWFVELDAPHISYLNIIIPLTPSGGNLTGSISLSPVCSGTFTITISNPCPIGSPVHGCVTCGPCDPTSRTWLIVTTGEADDVSFLPLVFVDGDPAGCVWRSAGKVWELQYEPDFSLWVLTNTVDGRMWTTPNSTWHCNGGNNMNSDVGRPASVAVVQPYDNCTPVVTTYNCVSGSCVPVAGSGGTYPTLSACQAACGIATGCCANVISTTVHMHVAEIVGGGFCTCDNGTYTLTYSVANSYWTTGIIDPCSQGVAMEFRLLCSGTSWKFQQWQNGVQQFEYTATINTCSPFSLTIPFLVNLNGASGMGECTSSATVTFTG